MSEDSSDEDMGPMFAFRADNIMKKQQEAYQELLKKVQEEDTAKVIVDEESELLCRIQEKLQKKPRGKKKAVSCKRRKKPGNEDDITKKENSPEINLPAQAKKKLLKIDLENNMERKRINALNKRVLNSCVSSTVDDQNISMEMEPEQSVNLKLSYLSEVSKLTISENEKFSSIISIVADLFKLKTTEITLVLRDEIISFNETPKSLNVKPWEQIDCVPYKCAKEVQDKEDSNKVLIKMQSNDCKKKIDIYAHKLEKFKDIMERYANLRSLPLKDLIFEFDGEKITELDTPDDLDMESGSCVDVKVSGASLKSVKRKIPSVPVVDLEKEEPPHRMLDICVLD